jgi:hypothetical protein
VEPRFAAPRAARAAHRARAENQACEVKSKVVALPQLGSLPISRSAFPCTSC